MTTRRVYLMRQGTYVNPIINLPSDDEPHVVWGVWQPADAATFRRARRMARRWRHKGIDPVQLAVLRWPADLAAPGDPVPEVIKDLGGGMYALDLGGHLLTSGVVTLQNATGGPINPGQLVYANDFAPAPPVINVYRVGGVSGGEYVFHCPRCLMATRADLPPDECLHCGLSFHGGKLNYMD